MLILIRKLFTFVLVFNFMYLTKEDLSKFDKDGYLIIKGLFSENELQDAENKLNEFVKKKPEDWEDGKEMAYYESNVKNNERILARVEKAVDYHSEIRIITESKKLMACLEDLMREKCVLFKDKINYKKPGGSGWAPHQDVQARWDDFARYFMNALITIDDNDVNNGCLQIAPGHHKRKLIGEYDTQLQEKDLEGMHFIPIPASKGDVVFFDGYTPHKSDPNLSNRLRKNIYLTYNRISEGDHRIEYFARKRKELPPDNERTKGMKIKDCYAHPYLQSK